MPPKGISKAAVALRDSFGDRSVPDISRKITACVACRKLKIKCNITDAEQPCTRCKSRGLTCTVNKSLQTILESDASWKESIEERIISLEQLQSRRNLNEGTEHIVTPIAESSGSARELPRGTTGTGVYGSPAHGTDQAIDFSTNLGAFPAVSSDQRVTDDSSSDRREGALSLHGIIPEQSVTRFLEYYRQHLNSQIHYILTSTDTSDEVAARSSLLITAICTVAAFCLGSEDYAKCMPALQAQVSVILFKAKYSFDDVRALCIASLWLNDSAAVFNGLAVRISTQLNLHRCITKVNTKEACYDRTRLYYLVYLCDHHCSLKHGRPPMTRDWRSLRPPCAFLQSQHSRNTDLMLISQVELWSISSRVFETFGADKESAGAAARTSDICGFDTEYQQWWSHWIDTMALGMTVGSRSTCELYFHEARLYLYSHVFRGPAVSTGHATRSIDLAGFTREALTSALAIIRIAINQADGAYDMSTWPTYHGVMVGYASLYLRKAIRHEIPADEAQKAESRRFLEQLATHLNQVQVAQDCSHHIGSIKYSLEHALAGFAPDSAPQMAAVLDVPFDPTLFTDDFWNMDFSLLDENWKHDVDH